MKEETLCNETDQLLYLCSLPEENYLNKQRLIRLTSAIKDWDHLLQKAWFHKLQTRLYSFLKRSGAPSFLKEEEWKKIEWAHRKAQFQVMALEGELLTNILPRFSEAGIDVLLLKGAALAQTVYKKRSIRFFVDLDLMIHREDLSSARSILQELGYKNSDRSPLPSRWHEQEIYSWQSVPNLALVHPEKETSLDIHLDAFEPWLLFRLKPDWLWQGAQLISLAGSRAFLPHPNNLFLHLLFHLVKHAETRENVFGWYLDLDECLRYFSREIDGHFCWEVIRANPHPDKILEVLAFLKLHFSSPLWEDFQSLLQERNVKPLTLESIFYPEKKSEFTHFNHPDWIDPRERFLLYWNQVSGFQKKILFLLHWFFPNFQYIRAKYHPRSNLDQAVAYLKHCLTTTLKGIGFVVYLVQKKHL